MRFIHIADVHLGAVPDKGYPWSQTRADEIWKSFRRVVEEAEKQKADLLLIAGDLFHRQPLLQELKEVNYLFRRLSQTQVVLIAGNHDHLQEGGSFAEFEWEENVVFLDGEECEYVYFRDLDTSVYGFSYYSREIRESKYDEVQPQGEGSCQILLAHGGDEAHIPINKKKLLQSGFDYIALGHIHKPQILEKDRMAYAGALEPLDPNDTGAHGYIFGESKGGKLHISFVPFAARSYVNLEVECDPRATGMELEERVESRIRELGKENFYRIFLTGYRSPGLTLCLDPRELSGNILEISDQTRPDYDLEELMREHRKDVIGKYLEKLLPGEDMGEESRRIRMQAVYYGIHALKKDD